MKDDFIEQCVRAPEEADSAVSPYEDLANAVLAIARPAILEEAAALVMNKYHIYGHSRENTAAAIRALSTTGQEGGR